ncbi:MAG: hypothetical protein Q9160_008391 [Pyrenula sp. 1 TL-2023]
MVKSTYLCFLFFMASFHASAALGPNPGVPDPLKCKFCCCQSEEEDCENRNPLQTQSGDTIDPEKDYLLCNNRPPKGQKWACEDESPDFPTVDCLVQDIKTCDLVNKNGASTIFYSFSANTNDVRPNVRNKLMPRGVMFNDALMSEIFEKTEECWWDQVAKSPRFHIGDPTVMKDPSKKSDYMHRQNTLVVRYSEALACVSTGNVYMVYGQYEGDGGLDDGLGGIYQKPREAEPNDPRREVRVPNAWRAYEFGTIQKHPVAKNIYGVDKSKVSPLDNVEWERGKGQKEMPERYAMELELPPTAENKAKIRRERCIAPLPPSSPEPTTSLKRPT